jgi:tripartite-type tricarboxylate transporter receptor subunit TctC
MATRELFGFKIMAPSCVGDENTQRLRHILAPYLLGLIVRICMIQAHRKENTAMMHKGILFQLFAAMAVVSSFGAASAQDAWPSRAIKIVVTFPPGGTSDLVARLLGPKLSASLGQPVVIENRSGGAGMIGADAVAKTAADGYTLVVSTPGSHSIAPTLNRNIKYNAVDDFTHIALIGSLPHVLLANKDFPAKNLKDLVAMAKQRPGRIDFGSGGSGSINHVIGELFKTSAGISLTHIPYRGSAAAMIDLRGNSIPLLVDALPANVAAIKNGDVRALAISTSKRSPLAPDVPTFAEQGFADVIAENWVGISGPAKMPESVSRRLAQEVERAMASPDIRDKLNEWGVIQTFKGPAEFTAFVRTDIARWRPVILRSGAQID